MTGHSPPARPGTQDARGGDTRGGQKTNKNYVRILNPIENGSPVVKRKVAERYVKDGWAKWDGADYIRLVMSCPRNKAKSAAAAMPYDAAVNKLVLSVAELKHLSVARPWLALTDRSVRCARHISGRSGPAVTILEVQS